MWKSKRFVLLSAVVVAVLVASVTAGVTLAQDRGGGGGCTGNDTVLLNKLCEIYLENAGVALDVDELKSAYTQAQTEMRSEAPPVSGNESQAGDGEEAFLSKVVAIYYDNTGVTIDAQQLKDALTQARTEMQTEALQSRLQESVTQGKITREQADEYLAWWNSRPDIGIDIVQLPGVGGGCGMMLGSRGPDFGGGNGTVPRMPDLADGNRTVTQMMPGFGGRR